MARGNEIADNDRSAAGNDGGRRHPEEADELEGYSQGRHGYGLSPNQNLGQGSYGQPQLGQGGYGQNFNSDQYGNRGRHGGGEGMAPGDNPHALGPGPHYGRGPKNYRRSDERIAEDINERLTEDALLDASGIHASVSDGVVTLQGSVGSRRMKHRAEDIVDQCRGVDDVRNHIRVAMEGSDETATGHNTPAARRSAPAGTPH